MWQVPLAGTVSPSTSSHFTDKASYKVTPLKTLKDMLYFEGQWQQTELFLLHQQMVVQNGMRNYRLASKHSDNKKWPINTVHERVLLFIFLASEENKIHKTISIHTWALQKQLSVVRDGEKYHIHAHSVDATTQKSVPAVLANNKEAKDMKRTGLTVLREMASTHSM